jgi:hypothetical protein
MNDFFQQFHCEADTRYSVIIEDDEKVAYAYLMDEGAIVSDVWLYNNGETPVTPPWKDGGKMPFANPAMYLTPSDQVLPLTDEDDVIVKWDIHQGRLENVVINIRQQLVAKMEHGSRPGWSRKVIADGPLAKVLE